MSYRGLDGSVLAGVAVSDARMRAGGDSRAQAEAVLQLAVAALGAEAGSFALPENVTRTSLSALAGLCALALADRFRDAEEFFENASHELRTPVATIKASAEVLLDVTTGGIPIEVKRLLLNITREAERLGTLIDDLLNLDSIRSGSTRLRLVRCDLRDIARKAAESIEPLARQRAQTVALDLPGAPVWAVVDEELLGRAILNLVSNAQKYGRNGGRVEVGLDVYGREALFAVRDDGPGIPNSDRERVFQRFYRAPTADGRRIQGSGLGLPICRAAVKLLGGRVWVESESGSGSVFSLAVPLGQEFPAGPGESA
jgi:signal transduction histidine kinase